MSLDFINPFASNHILIGGQINLIPSMCTSKSLKFFCHCFLPKRVRTCLVIYARFIGDNGRIANIITKKNRKLTYMRRATKWRWRRNK